MTDQARYTAMAYWNSLNTEHELGEAGGARMNHLYIDGRLITSRRRALRAVNYARTKRDVEYLYDEIEQILFSVDSWLRLLDETTRRGYKLVGRYTMYNRTQWNAHTQNGRNGQNGNS